MNIKKVKKIQKTFSITGISHHDLNILLMMAEAADTKKVAEFSDVSYETVDYVLNSFYDLIYNCVK